MKFTLDLYYCERCRMRVDVCEREGCLDRVEAKEINMDTGVETLIAQCVAERDQLREALTAVQAKCTEQCELIRTLKTQTLGGIAKRAHYNSVAKGFWDGDSHNIAEKLCLIHSEVSEALEWTRVRESVATVFYEEKCNPEICYSAPNDHANKPVGFPTELADIIIRVADLAGYLMIDLDGVTAEKMAYNETRPAKHGKRF